MSRTSTPVKSIDDDVMASLDKNISKDALHEIIGTKLPKCDIDKVEDNTPVKDESSSTSTSSKTSNELKSILQLAKEAKLDTNIAHKRKSVDVSKSNDRLESSEKNVNDDEALDSGSDEIEDSKLKFREMRDRLNQKLKTYEGNEECASCNIIKGNKKSKDKNVDKEVSTNTTLTQEKDTFCWRCQKTEVNISCETCPRSYHTKCVKQSGPQWQCPECVLVMKAENIVTRSAAMKEMTIEHLCSLLKFALKRMMQCSGSEPFLNPVNEQEFPEYRKYIVQPMDLTHLEYHIKNNVYGSTQAFEADAKWMLHNSIIFNGYRSKLTTTAKSMVKVCKQEMQEIENCHTCYLNANIKKKSWFVEVCPKPHILLWAKLKSFPYWPAKAMATNSQGMVDARFFGAHDRAWVPVKDCYLFSRKDPNSNNIQKNNINECIKELEVHAAKLKEVYGEFNYAPYKTPFDPVMETEQLKIFLPKYKPPVDSQKSVNKIKTYTSGRSSSSNSNDNASSNSYKKRARSRSRHRKSINENKDLEEYGSDEEYYETRLNEEKRKQLLKTFDADEKDVKSSDVPPQNIEEKSNDKSEDTNKTDTTNEVVEENGHETVEPVPKRSRRYSEKSIDRSIKNYSRRQSTPCDKINKINVNDSMEITLGNCTSVSSISSSDSSNCEVMEEAPKSKTAVQIDVENKELAISPQSKTKISDKIIRILNQSEEAATSTTVEDKEITQTDLLLKKYNQNTEAKEAEIEYIDVSNLNAKQKVTENKIEKVTKNLLEDTQIDEANINSMIHSSSENKTVTTTTIESNTAKKGQKRSLDSVETNDGIEGKALKLTYPNSSDAALAHSEIDPLAHVEIKCEPCSDNEDNSTSESTAKVTNVNTKSKLMDNVTKIINDVAAGFAGKTIVPPKESEPEAKHNKARKSFPAPTSKTDVQVAPQQPQTQNPPASNSNPAPPLIRIIPTNKEGNVAPTKNTNIQWSESQNYIPQTPNQSASFIKLSDVQTNIGIQASTSSQYLIVNTPNQCISTVMEEFRALKDVLPEAAAKAVSDLMCRPPPALKPRPPSAISQGFEETIPSAAGAVTAMLNSVAYRMSDYFRGMLTETLHDLSKNFGDNTATIATLKTEIEQLKHKHSLEIIEIKKNVYSILKDIQKNIVEEQKKIVEETRASCEAETAKRIQEAKSKQWCAQCLKEARFYCCWNTSYCDYQCQQKHWPKHMSKCTQNFSNLSAVPKPQVQPLVLRPAPPPKNMSGKPLLTAKPTKVVFNSRTANSNQIAQIMKSKPTNHIRLVESTPGNYEIIGNTTSLKVGGKLITSTAVVGKLKPGNILTVNSASNSTIVSSSPENSTKVAVTTSPKTKTFDLPTISNVMSLAE